MTTPIERSAGLVIGQVESVSPDEVRVSLDLEAPTSTALNAGSPSAFPRINGYVIVPNEVGATVGLISWVGAGRAPWPKGTGKDSTLVDLPFSQRRMSISPVATLVTKRQGALIPDIFELRRGVTAFPSVGDQVLLPSPEQLSAIVGANEKDRRVQIGITPMAGDAAIAVDPDKLFGRHLAILGNTGSGKSCSVAGLIRWSLDAAFAQRKSGKGGVPNARFIVLDPNGEYLKTFQDLGTGCRIFRVPPVAATLKPLAVPAWLWNSQEWAAFAHAQPGAQRPILIQGLRDLRAGAAARGPFEAKALRQARSFKTRLEAMIGGGAAGYSGTTPAKMNCGRMMDVMAEDAAHLAEQAEDQNIKNAFQFLADAATGAANRRRSGAWFNDFSLADLEGVSGAIDPVVALLPADTSRAEASEDSPIPFDSADLSGHLESLAAEQGGNTASFIATLTMRIRTMLADRRLGPVVMPDVEPMFSAWLNDYVGANEASNGQVAVIDLSLVPSDVIHVVVAVLARVVFEALQRHRRILGAVLPTVMVLEEAHTFVRRAADEDNSAVSPTQMCRQVFERIAREGRKFGLGLVLSSQRPSELSPTALAQCNTFLLHRLVNDRDQELVSKLVPDNLGGLLRELPSLPSRQAILLGWATPIPVLVEMTELPENHRPHSDDPDFWAVWTGSEKRPTDWESVAKDWTS